MNNENGELLYAIVVGSPLVIAMIVITKVM